MIEKTIEELQQLIPEVSAKLKAIQEAKFTEKPQTDKWSIKEIIGHLIDSATNNHHRFIRCQYEDKPLIKYDQDLWVASQNYQNKPSEEIILLWELYNKHLVFVMENIPQDKLASLCLVAKANEPVTLQWLIEDYLAHLKRHLTKIFSYNY